MKKIIAYLLVAAMCVTSLVACGEKKNEDLTAAIDIIKQMYLKEPGAVTSSDYTVVPQVKIGETFYKITWTVDNESIKIIEGEDAITIDVDEKSPTEVAYKLTATVSDDKDSESISFEYTVPAFEGYGKIVDAAYELKAGETLDGTYTIEGVITSVDTAYDSGYKNVTVTIQVEDKADKKIMCYRLKGEGADTIKIGDTITVTGTIKNYNGTIEFDAGCSLDKVVVGDAPAPELPVIPEGATMEQIVDIAYTLISGQIFEKENTLTGVITEVTVAYDESYGNVSVKIQVGDKADKPIICHRLKGTGADKIKVGDTITVTGKLKNYAGTIEFDAGCNLDSYKAASTDNPSTDKPNTDKPNTDKPNTDTPNTDNPNTDKPSTDNTDKAMADLVNQAYQLKSGESMTGTQTLKGIVTKVKTYYDGQYGNVTIYIQVGDLADKTICCFRLKGDHAADVLPGDEVTVSGTLSNYNGEVQFGQGCTIDNYKKNSKVSNVAVPEGASQSKILELAFGLKEGCCLTSRVSLTGKITSAEEYSAQYSNRTFTITIDGKDVLVFRAKGDGIDTLKVGDTVTVTGVIVNHNGTIEFTSGGSVK